MILTAIFAAFVLILLGLLFSLLLPLVLGKKPEKNARQLKLEDLGPLHSRHFPQIRQTLSASDDAFLRARISAAALRAWQGERRRVVRKYLAGLREDFAQLNRMARTVAALSPEVNRAREIEQLWLDLKFRALYGFAELQLLAGSVSLPQLTQLTQLVGSLTAQTEAAMAALEKESSSQLRTTFSA